MLNLVTYVEHGQPVLTTYPTFRLDQRDPQEGSHQVLIYSLKYELDTNLADVQERNRLCARLMRLQSPGTPDRLMAVELTEKVFIPDQLEARQLSLIICADTAGWLALRIQTQRAELSALAHLSNPELIHLLRDDLNHFLNAAARQRHAIAADSILNAMQPSQRIWCGRQLLKARQSYRTYEQRCQRRPQSVMA